GLSPFQYRFSSFTLAFVTEVVAGMARRSSEEMSAQRKELTPLRKLLQDWTDVPPGAVSIVGPDALELLALVRARFPRANFTIVVDTAREYAALSRSDALGNASVVSGLDFKAASQQADLAILHVGGREGKAALHARIESARAHLNPGGVLLVLTHLR